MATQLLFLDNFADYADQAAFEAAYDFVSLIAWGLTEGPEGQPGIVPTGPFLSAGAVRKVLNPCGPEFGFGLRTDHEGGQSVLTIGTGVSNPLVQLLRGTSPEAEAYTVMVRTVDSGMFDPNWWTSFFSITQNVPVDVWVDGRVSTLVETSPGVFEPDTDGFVLVYIDNDLVAEFHGPVWNGISSQSSARPYWDTLNVEPGGHVTNLEVWHDTSCGDPMQSDFCECIPDGEEPTPPGTPGGHGAPPFPIPPVIGQQLACDGGGLVPIEADLVHAELWWGL